MENKELGAMEFSASHTTFSRIKNYPHKYGVPRFHRFQALFKYVWCTQKPGTPAADNVTLFRALGLVCTRLRIIKCIINHKKYHKQDEEPLDAGIKGAKVVCPNHILVSIRKTGDLQFV